MTDQAKAKKIEIILKQLESLPTLPSVATRLFQAATAEDISTKEIVKLIESDQSLTAKILALTRKAKFGIRSADTVEKAVLMLGFEAVKNAVLSIQVFEVFSGDRKDATSSSFDRKELWKHSLAVACAGQLIAETLGPKCKYEPEEVFVCGLLHDIGKVAFSTILPKSFDRIVQLAESTRTSISEVERRILGIDHSAAGKRLAEYWKLPEKISQVIWLHHHRADAIPEQIEHKDLIEIIYIADVIAREQRIGFSGNFYIDHNGQQLCNRIGIKDTQYDDILLKLRDLIGQKATMLGLDELTSEKLYQQALKNANEELGRLNEELSIIKARFVTMEKYTSAIRRITQYLLQEVLTTSILPDIAKILKDILGSELILFTQNNKENYIEAALSSEDKTRLFEVIKTKYIPQTEEILAKPLPYLADLIKTFASRLGPFPSRVIPFNINGQTIGGIIVAENPKLISLLEEEKNEFSLLLEACTALLAQGLTTEEKRYLSEQLAAITYKMQVMEEKLVEAKSIARISEMAAGAAHELNNPLTVISGRAQLILQKAQDAELKESVQTIIEEVKNASSIINSLMEFAKPLSPNKEQINIEELINDLADEFCSEFKLNRSHIITNVCEDAQTVLCDRNHLRSAIKEIFKNSFEAAHNPEELKIKVSTANDIDSKNVVISIEDNGPGMDYETLNKAITPFFSSKKAGRKRGMGLSLAYRYIQVNSGNMWLESMPSRGVSVYITLPKPKRHTNIA